MARPEGLSLLLRNSGGTSLGGEELSRVDFLINDLKAGAKPTMEIVLNSTAADIEFLAAFYGKQVLPKVSIAKTVSCHVRSDFILTGARICSYSLQLSEFGIPEISFDSESDGDAQAEDPTSCSKWNRVATRILLRLRQLSRRSADSFHRPGTHPEVRRACEFVG
jgi:hypothetical protein